MHANRFVPLAALLSIVMACSSSTPIATGTLTGKAVIQGEPDSSGIVVSAGGLATTTDASGNYRIADLPLGSYAVTAIAHNTVEGTLAQLVTVQGGSTAAPDIVFRPVVLSGIATVVGSPGIAGISVQLDGGGTTSTASDGSFSFKNVSEGFHSLTFTAPSGYSDKIPSLYFIPGIAPLVPDSKSGGYYEMLPFELQAGRHIASSSRISPSYVQSSLDGTTFAYVDNYGSGVVADYKLYVVKTDGTPVFVADAVSSSVYNYMLQAYSIDAVLSPTGEWIAFRKGTDLYVAKTTDGVATKLASNVDPAYAFSPLAQAGVAQTIYYVSDDGNPAVATLHEMTMGGLSQNTFAPVAYSQARVYYKAKRLVFFDAGISKNVWRTAGATGKALLPAEIADFEAGFALSWVSPDESRVLYMNGPLKSATMDGAVVKTLETTPAGWTGPYNLWISPNGKRAIYSYYQYVSPGYNYILYSKDTDAAAATTQLWSCTACSYSSASVSFAPDEAHVLYAGSYPTPTLYYGAVDKPSSDASTQLVASSAQGIGTSSVSPDGSRLLYGVYDSSYVYNLWVKSVVGSATQVASGVSTWSAFADSSHMLYTKSASGVYSLYLASAQGGAPVLLSANYPAASASYYNVSPDLTRILLKDNRRNLTGVGYVADTKVVNISTGAVSPLIGQAIYSAWAKAGTTSNIVNLRLGSAPPYTFQDGFYVSDVP